MLALAHFEAGLCRKCGHDLHESTDPQWRWTADEPAECMSCTVLVRAERRYAKAAEKGGDGSVPPEAMIHTVRKRPDPLTHRG